MVREKMAKNEKTTLAIIIPTYNEKENLPRLIKEIFFQLKKDDITTEVIVVDDNSPDGTGKVAEDLSKKYPLKVINRPAKTGLATAVMDGIRATSSEIIGVMDSDLSHDPSVIPKMLDAIVRQKNQLVVGSRYVKGGKIENWPFLRKLISWVAIVIAFPFTKIKDRTSGYFFFRREVIDGIDLNPTRFKIGLEIMVKGNYKRWKEIPYVFRNRAEGKSKFDFNEIKNYLSQLKSFMFYKKNN